MFPLLSNICRAERLHELVIRAPRIARACRAGQFVIVRHAPGDERIPLTISDADAQVGTITLYVQALGASTKIIAATPAGESFRDVAGPLGMPSRIMTWGRVVCVGGGVGTAMLMPLVRALNRAGNQVTTIIGGRSGSAIILADQLAALSKTLIITTEDGSSGVKDLVTAALAPLLADPAQLPRAVFAVGPVAMMKAVAEQTRPLNIPTIASLNPIMIDGTGMCGGCRVQIGSETKFACVDGPEFDAHLVDFDTLTARLTSYHAEEPRACPPAECTLNRESAP